MKCSRGMGILPFLAVVSLMADFSNSINGVPDNKVDGKSLADAEFFMMKYGYLKPKDPRLGRLRTKEEMITAIKEVQRFAGIPVTGVVDAATVKMMKTSRCGRPDFGPPDNMRRKKRYAIQGTKWHKLDLTFRIKNKPSRAIDIHQVRGTIRKAFGMWSQVTPLKFREIGGGVADIMISFQRDQHDDGYPFDGEGGTLAHGFYPNDNKVGLAGDVHFDDDEHWLLKNPKTGTDFLWTAIHEIGHAIGLDHSYYKAAIMYPYYQGYEANLQLNEDDITGIQRIYGKPKKPTKPPQIKPRSTFNGPSPCQSSFDAVFHSKNGNTYFFKDHHFWKIDENNVVSDTLKVSEYWPKLRGRIQAAYTRRDGKTVLFKGRRYWVYEGTKYIEGPKKIIEYGLPESLKRLDAVFVWGANGKTYFFKGDKYWRYNEVAKTIDPGYPKNISRGWGAVPQPVDAVMTWKDGNSYFFNRHRFQLYNFDKRNHFRPQNSGDYFFLGCKFAEQSLGSSGVGRGKLLAPVLFLLSFAVSFVNV